MPAPGALEAFVHLLLPEHLFVGGWAMTPTDEAFRSVASALPSDRSLLRRYREGNQDAATQLYLRYARRLTALARVECGPDLTRWLDVEDIVQSVFGSFFRGVDQGDYDVPAGEELWRLFCVIALNKIRAKGVYLHAAKRDIRQTVGGQIFDEAGVSSPNDEAALAFLELTIQDALERLPPLHRTMLELRTQGYEVLEISRQTGRAKRTVERILQEGRETLRGLLAQGD
jgi:RNA polymerase sigma-70 factor (ECF subfamily)